jgi:hypothetical protein
MKLTDNQKAFLLDYFFKNEVFPGWKSIASKLLDNGNCIVAGDTCIWKGGIGNFIKVRIADDFEGCCEYKFDLEDFLDSNWFKEIHNYYIAELAQKKREIENEFNEIIKL